MPGTGRTLEGKVAVVTGASAGIGAQIARELGDAGAQVVLVGRDRTRLGEVHAQLESAGAGAAAVRADVTTDGGPAEVVGRALDRFGAIDVLAHAAGVFLPTPFGDTIDELLAGPGYLHGSSLLIDGGWVATFVRRGPAGAALVKVSGAQDAADRRPAENVFDTYVGSLSCSTSAASPASVCSVSASSRSRPRFRCRPPCP